MRALVIGGGFVGQPLAQELLRQGHHVTAMTRSQSHADSFQALGIQPIVADISHAASLPTHLDPFDWVINLVSSGRGGVEAYRAVYLSGTRHVIEWLASIPPRQYVAASSTSVYGQVDGSFVTEESPTEPGSETGRVLVEMETLLLEAASAGRLPVLILRLAGIYGPGRTHWIDRFRRPELALESPPGSVVNMIHRDDVVGAILAALAKGRPGEIYNVVDDEPVSRAELSDWLSQRLGQPQPAPSSDVAPRARTRPATNKRVLNRKLRSELGYALRYPTFREGFAAELG